MTQPEHESGPSPADEPVADLGDVDVEAILNQAEQLADTAAAELGPAESTSAGSHPNPVDPSQDADATPEVEQQLAEVTALVAEANHQAADWAAEDAKPVAASPAAAVAPSVADQVAAPEAPGETAESPSAEPVGATKPNEATETPPETENAAAPPADSPQEPIAQSPGRLRQFVTAARERAGPVAERSLRAFTQVVCLLNFPFRRIGEVPRRIGGIIAVATMLTAAVVWSLPLLLDASRR
ncbi:MAG: hypothetical protein V3T70_00435 [Phycisphaerae bacterium]